MSERWLGPLSPQRASDTCTGSRWLSLSFWPPWPAYSAVAAARPGREPSITPKEEVVRWGLAYRSGVGLTWGDWNKCARPWKEEVEANEQRQIQTSHDSAWKVKHFLSSANDTSQIHSYSALSRSVCSVTSSGKSVSFMDQGKLQTDVSFPQFEAFQQLSKSEFRVFFFVMLTDLARNLESKGGKHWLEVQSVLLEEKPVFQQLVGSEPLILPGAHTRH